MCSLEILDYLMRRMGVNWIYEYIYGGQGRSCCWRQLEEDQTVEKIIGEYILGGGVSSSESGRWMACGLSLSSNMVSK